MNFAESFDRNHLRLLINCHNSFVVVNRNHFSNLVPEFAHQNLSIHSTFYFGFISSLGYNKFIPSTGKSCYSIYTRREGNVKNFVKDLMGGLCSPQQRGGDSVGLWGTLFWREQRDSVPSKIY